MILGQYKLRIEKGQVTLMGYTLQASETSYPVFALASHSLPVIRCLGTEIDDAEISLHQYQSGIETLAALSPLFDNLGNNHACSVGSPYDDTPQIPVKSTFQIVSTLR